MKYKINNAVVIGAGTMGAAIAAHLANNGVAVTLLDIVPRELNKKEKAKGLKLDSKVVRNRIVNDGLTAAIKSRPASFYAKDLAEHVSTGNLEDDFDVVANADWVIEVIVENLAIKQSLMERIDKVRGKHAIISTNTSGIPIASIAEGRSESFRKHLLGVHFFNPPRYLKLLEIISGPETLPEVIDFISEFGERRLGKGIVLCKDTPNFIGNRFFSVGGSFAMDYIAEHGYTVAEVDAISGKMMGRPNTATFRLIDLVGVDVANHVRDNLADLIPEDEVAQKYLRSEKANKASNAMVENGWLGNKNKIGFYKMVINDSGKKEFWTLNLETLEHEPPPEKPKFESIGKVKDIDDPASRLKALVAEDDRAAKLARAMTYFGFYYASLVIPEISDLPKSIDDATRWGFMHEAGPFELWDAFGVAETIEKMKLEGFEPAAWVKEMLDAGFDTFYQYNGKEKIGVYHPEKKEYQAYKFSPSYINLQSMKDAGKLVEKNDGASIVDMGDGVALLEFHTKMNALDADIGQMVNKVLDMLDTDFDALVIGNQGEHFSAGANLFLIAMYAQQEQWDELKKVINDLQDMNMRMRYSQKPVVVAPFGYTLGGGTEVTMHGSRVVAAAETYAGLVEAGMGLVPAGGGTKEIMRRVINPAMRTENAFYLPYVQRSFMQIGMVKVATSAYEAKKMGMLSPTDRIVTNQDHLLAEAKREARHMADAGYVAPMPEKIFAAGRDVLSSLRAGLNGFLDGKYISEHDAVVGKHVANILAGGNISQSQWVDEQYILDLECEAFLSLCGEAKTQERIWHFLQTGKPLRN
ncbi:MAG: 3-hydroxyacyl-CoA dehydrogenase/enoyl-CoA hydratase family protein [Chloroflexi bacterium]|nr:3-hydroxyacyl-CoA dehydrogenase/enoyl-CoA hydratase family protein [Chloroflexota bacterium]MBT3668929.1 3-hydroxyacyl-CoA dehydrogenase/enoyl-CoA hydratase family protein [Chloroflexota bacterium]MBT4305344.1 3-hydroxyacyl-CoA dehydrogenase/enoyl-CoA hydratase family protein [Chloroflexota bacterium]MBT4532490.1 3-hydroxyacyl-CoA dehydrogenase/enoyl-CoA hydratase family protein [Chloroflexota bacterium]MBT4683151.1 3-hydroxyacyl-CoA dehydrogenase/enoyl-CoA hydratase family protein [Chlorofl